MVGNGRGGIRTSPGGCGCYGCIVLWGGIAPVLNPMRERRGSAAVVCSAMGSCPSGCLTLWSWTLWVHSPMGHVPAGA